ncbi:MAG: LptF/LptG family permease [Nitrospiraceae bacterium]|nr:LptF/LptG family permease [Nitrospiraceae bacterium]
MSIVSRYLIQRFLVMLGLIFPGLIGFYLLVEIFERVNDFVDANAPISLAISYFSLTIPQIFYEFTPLAVLLAGLLTISLLSRHMELLALSTLGIRPKKIMLPFFFVAIPLSIVLVILQAFWIPRMTAKAQRVMQVEVEKNPPKGMLQGNRLFYLGDNCIWSAELGDPSAYKLKGVQWLSFDKSYKIIRLMAAKEAIYSGKKWIFRHGISKERIKKGYLVRPFDSLDLKLSEIPEDFVSIETPTKQMDMASLWERIQRLKKAGYSAKKQEVVLWGQLLYPFLGCSLLFIGLLFMLSKERGGLSLGLSLGLIIGFTTWIVWNFALTLSETSKIPAFLGPVAVHLILIVMGLALMKHLRF